MRSSSVLALALIASCSAFSVAPSRMRVASYSIGVAAAPPPPLLTASRAPAAAMLSGPALIDAAVSFDTFAPQFLWLLIVAFPRAQVTEAVMGPIVPLIALSLVHLAVVVTAATAPGGTEPILIFADVFDPAKSQLDGMVRLFEVRDFVAEEWPHVLIWDLFVGRAIWLDSLERGTPFTWSSLLLTNGIGPPGMLLYVLLCLVSGKGLPSLGYVKQDR